MMILGFKWIFQFLFLSIFFVLNLGIWNIFSPELNSKIKMEDSLITSNICDAPPNPIVAENCKPGTINWQINNYYYDIEGFASKTSVNIGESIDFYINSLGAKYDLAIFRSGYYGGLGGRLI